MTSFTLCASKLLTYKEAWKSRLHSQPWEKTMSFPTFPAHYGDYNRKFTAFKV